MDRRSWRRDLVKEQGNGIAFRVRKINHDTVKRHVDRFSVDSGTNLTLDSFRNKFLKKVMQSSLAPRARKNFRPIICSLLSYLMMYETRVSDLRLRALQSGSIEPFLNHLFSGCLTFESLMKTRYSRKGIKNTLGNFINTAIQKGDLGIKNKIYKNGRRNIEYTLKEILDKLNSLERKGNFAEVSIGITYLLRNTTGHSLSWPDKFNENIYKRLFDHVCNAIFWFISKSTFVRRKSKNI